MKHIKTFESHNSEPNKISLFLKAKHFKDIHNSPYIGSPNLCVLQHAFLDQFGREGDAQGGFSDHRLNDSEGNKDFFSDLEKDIDYVYDEYNDDDFESDYDKSESKKWDDSIIRTIILIEDYHFDNLKSRLRSKS